MSTLLGKQAELRAENFLIQHGFKIIKKNFSSRFGEIDLIAKNTDTLIFVEVKFRTQTQFGRAIEMVSLKKQHKIRLTAQFFLQQYFQFQSLFPRFDVIAFEASEISPLWVQNAF